MDEDKLMDIEVKNFLKELKNVGEFSKKILNYSYPPLLYQRGDDDDEDEEEDDNHDGLPDFGAELDEDEDKDIQELIQGGNKNKNGKSGQNQDEIYNKLRKVVNDKEA